MNRCATFAAALAALTLLGGCAAPPLAATWYLIEDDQDRAALYVVLVNQSSETQKISGLKVNTTPGLQGSGHLIHEGPLTLDPGNVLTQLVTWPQPAHDRPPGCQVPVTIALESGGKQWLLKPPGHFPSALPAAWRLCTQARP